MEYNCNNKLFITINNLINSRNYSKAEELLNNLDNNTSEYHYLYSLLLQKKAWFEEACIHLKKAIEISPENTFYKSNLISLMSRHRHYSDDYYNGGYRKSHGCSCCCCDDCCSFSCCDLICLDQCCECMGGDLISCI